MSSFGDKIKSALGSDHSSEAERGIVDHRTPGSFPNEEPTASAAGAHHRAADPASVPGTGRAATGATGLPPSEIGEDRSGQKPEHSVTDAYGSSTGRTTGDSVTGDSTHASSQGRQQEGLKGSVPEGSAGAAAAAAFSSHEGQNLVHNGREKSTVEREEPYWGTLPQGAGVYNTVTGHGSNENTTAQHRHVPLTDEASAASPNTHGSQLSHGAGVYNTVTGHGSSRNESSQIPGQARDRVDPLAATTTSSTYANQTPEANKDHHLAEAGVGAGAGVAAYGAMHNRKETEGSQTQPSAISDDNTSKHVPHSQSSHTKDESEHSKGLGFLHRSKDVKDDDKHATHHKEKSHPEEKREGGVFGIFHKNKDDKSTHDPSSTYTSQSHATTDDTSIRATKPEHGDRDSNRVAAGLAGVGAGGAAAYGASKLGHHEDQKNQTAGTGTSSQYGTEQKTPTVAGVGSSNNTAPAYSSAPQQQSTSYPSTTKDSTATTTPGYSSDPSRTGTGAFSSSNDPLSSTSQYQTSAPAGYSTASTGREHDSHVSPAAAGAAGAGTGAGAAYGASKLAQSNSDKQDSLQSDAATHRPTEGSNTYHSTGPSDEHFGSRGVADPTATSGSKSGGQYNVLSSGTPSGVQVGDDTTTSSQTTGHGVASKTSSPSTTIGTAANQPQISDRTKESAVAGGAAAAATGVAAATTSKAADNSKVIHKCTHCGEDNDISRYFKD